MLLALAGTAEPSEPKAERACRRSRTRARCCGQETRRCCLGDDAHRLVEDFAAAAVGGKDITGGAACVLELSTGAVQGGRSAPAQRRRVARRRTGSWRWARGWSGTSGRADAEAFAAVDFGLVSDHAELAVAGLDNGFADKVPLRRRKRMSLVTVRILSPCC